MSKKVKTGNERVRIVPLGGLEQIGMNITAFETEDMKTTSEHYHMF